MKKTFCADLLIILNYFEQGNQFEVQAGNLGFSVTVFTLCAITTIAMLMIRRMVPALGSAELGGPNVTKYLTGGFLVCLWFLYVILSSLQTYGIIQSPF